VRQLKVLVLGPGAWRKLPSLVLLAVGWLLSPLCWWNDLVINVPLALGFAKMMSWLNPAWLLPALVLGYWLSNVAGVLLMQNGALALLPDQKRPRGNREVLWGLLTSTLLSLGIVVAIQMGWLALPQLETFLTSAPQAVLGN
jgi:hypothetical protein